MRGQITQCSVAIGITLVGSVLIDSKISRLGLRQFGESGRTAGAIQGPRRAPPNARWRNSAHSYKWHTCRRRRCWSVTLSAASRCVTSRRICRLRSPASCWLNPRIRVRRSLVRGLLAPRNTILSLAMVHCLRRGSQSTTSRWRYLNSRRKAIFAQMDELANFKVSAEQALHAGALPAVPLIVLARNPQLGGCRCRA